MALRGVYSDIGIVWNDLCSESGKSKPTLTVMVISVDPLNGAPSLCGRSVFQRGVCEDQKMKNAKGFI